MILRSTTGTARSQLLRAACGLLLPAVLLAAGCSAGGAGGTAVAVTVSTPASSAPRSAPTSSASGRIAPESTSSSTTPSTSGSSATTPGLSGATTPGLSGATTPTRTTVSTPGPVQPSADVNVAGPDNGPPCPVDKQYSDEPPTGLRPDVLAAWRSVKKQAAAKGVTLCLNDGKRSKAQQIALYRLYVKEYGAAAADDLVLPWNRSAHVKGYAVDVQPAQAYQWLQATRGRLGFCRIYDNEPWHFEYSTVYRTSGCPPRQPKP